MRALFAAKQAKLFYYQLPFIRPMTFNGQTLACREGLILQLMDQSGHCSFTEIAPLPGFSKETLQQATKQIISLLNNKLKSKKQRNELYPSVRFALDCALHKTPATVKINNLDAVPLLQGNNASVLKQYRSLNCPALIKLKVARQCVANDVLLFKQLSTLNASLAIRCDANQAWSAPQADEFFSHIERRKLAYIEEPTRGYQDNLELAEKYQISLALDETLQDINFNYQRHDCVKAFILKPTLIGSLQRLQRFIDIARQQQLQVHISSSFESVVGLQQLAYLANTYQKECRLSLGIDTLKYFQPGLLTGRQQIKQDLQKLECLWSSN